MSRCLDGVHASASTVLSMPSSLRLSVRQSCLTLPESITVPRALVVPCSSLSQRSPLVLAVLGSPLQLPVPCGCESSATGCTPQGLALLASSRARLCASDKRFSKGVSRWDVMTTQAYERWGGRCEFVSAKEAAAPSLEIPSRT